ncbi:hypothetical protein ACOME3_004139 [Neoechinorhynchus agilis]
MGYVMDLVKKFQNNRQITNISEDSSDDDEDEQSLDETYTVVWRTTGDQQDMIDTLTELYPFHRTRRDPPTRRNSTSITECVQNILGSIDIVASRLDHGCEISFRLLKPDEGYNQKAYHQRILIIFDSSVERLYDELQSIIGILAIGHDSSTSVHDLTSDFVIALHRGSWYRAKILYSMSSTVTVRLIDTGVRCVVYSTNLVPIPMKYVTCLPPKSLVCNSKWIWSVSYENAVLRGKIKTSNLNRWYVSPHFEEPRIELEESKSEARVVRSKSFSSLKTREDCELMKDLLGMSLLKTRTRQVKL